MLTRRGLFALSGAALLAGTVDATAQDWPQRTIRVIVPFGPGGGADIIGRIIAQAMQERLGQPVVIENRPGAAGTLGNEAVARADKDGYTLGIMTAGQIIAGIRDMAGSRRHTIGVTYLETLTDILVHGQDIAIPLGRRHDMPPRAAAVAASRVLTMRWPPPLAAAAHVALVAQDAGYRRGSACTR